MVYTGNNIDKLLKQLEHIKIDRNINNLNIATQTGKSPQMVSNFFKGRQANMTLNTLLMYCNALDCDLIIDIKSKADIKDCLLSDNQQG